MVDPHTLPDSPEALKRLVIELRGQIEHLKLQLAKLRRARFGQSSEQLKDAGQMALTLEALQSVLSQVKDTESPHTGATAQSEVREAPKRRKELPEHLPREDNLIQPGCTCPECGGPLKAFGKPDTAEVLEVKTITFTVTRHIRPKGRCAKCSTIVQAPAPPRPIEKSYAGASVLAQVLHWKYGCHLPLYRQQQMFAQSGLVISRTTLMQWVGGSSRLLEPLADALGRYVLCAPSVHADDTPVKVLAPGTGKTKRGHLWTYVRDGRRWGSTDPPAVWYQYSPSWAGKYPQRHLADFTGKLQADGYAGFNPLFEPSGPGQEAQVLEVACWAHSRRKVFDLYEAQQSPSALEALERIKALYAIEAQIKGRSPEERRVVRQERAVPLLNALRSWMIEVVSKVEKGSALAGALNYSLNQWDALMRYTDDGCLEIDNSAAERSLRGVGTGRKNYMFFGADTGGERAAIIYGLIESCKLNHIDPRRYLEYVLRRIAEHPINRIDELLPWNVADQLGQPDQVTQAMAA